MTPVVPQLIDSPEIMIEVDIKAKLPIGQKEIDRNQQQHLFGQAKCISKG
jgi:hypothetical protein